VPHVVHATDEEAEINEVAQWVSALLADGFAPREIGIFVRSREYLDRARAVLKRIEHSGRSLAEGTMPSEDDISIGTMHFAKGLEFRAVAVMACDDEALPLQTRIETARDEADLDEIYATERHLLYVACTRARDRLLVSGCRPVSDFLRLFSN
jgi:superfamily I DNA/RNA helicase